MSSKIPDVFDNCPAIPNADQTDADGDGTGDLCDVPSVVTAHLDIKPGSCPNPFNLKLYDFLDDGKPTKGGVLPVAILGSASFDVAEIDITTLSLEGVAPRQKGGGPKFEDVATPFVGAECSCTDAGPDGITDLMMHFSSQEVAAAVPIGVGGEKRALTLTGQLLDGTSFEASDCVTFVGHSSAAKLPVAEDLALDGSFPNPFNPVTRISYILPREGLVSLTVYDIKGRFVDRLISETKHAGQHVVEWDADGLPSGVYFLRLESAGQVRTSKIVLLK